MAERNFDHVETLGRKRRAIYGSFVPNGSSAIDNTANTGTGFTVAYVSTGFYRVSFTDKYSRVVYASARLAQGTRTQDVEVKEVSGPNGVLEIHGFARGGTALQDITAAAGTVIYFEAVFDDSLQA